MNLRALRARLDAVAAHLPAPTEPELGPTTPEDEARMAELEAKLLASRGPLDHDAQEFLRLCELVRQVAAVEAEAARNPTAIDVKAELEARAKAEEAP